MSMLSDMLRSVKTFFFGMYYALEKKNTAMEKRDRTYNLKLPVEKCYIGLVDKEAIRFSLLFLTLIQNQCPCDIHH